MQTIRLSFRERSLKLHWCRFEYASIYLDSNEKKHAKDFTL